MTVYLWVVTMTLLICAFIIISFYIKSWRLKGKRVHQKDIKITQEKALKYLQHVQ